MKKREIIKEIYDGVVYANMAVPCIGLIVMFILSFINVAYTAIFGFLFCGAYLLEVLFSLQMMSTLDSLNDKMEENEET